MKQIILSLLVLFCTITNAQEFVQTTTDVSYSNKNFRTSGKFSIGDSDAEELGGGSLNIKRKWGNWISFIDGYSNDSYKFHNPENGGRMELFVYESELSKIHWGAFTIKNNANIGIGTTTPQEKLHINGNVLSDSYLVDLSSEAGITFDDENNSLSIGDIGNSDVNTKIIGFGNTSQIFMSDASIRIATGSGSAGADNTSEIMSFERGNLGIGTTDTQGFKLGVNGKIAATEVKVALMNNWSDFVFYDDYKLPTLTEVEKHITEKGHLKDIPSAAEVAENGILLGDMNAKLLQKIEELTLYTIAQEKSLTSQNKKIELLIKRLEALESK